MNEPTAWEDINPPMASAPRPAPLPACSDPLAPASREKFAVELTACLALVAPVGMDEAARREWLAVAWKTVGHLPGDVLESACRTARQTVDHPAKLVPAIIAASEYSMSLRRISAASRAAKLPPPDPLPAIDDKPLTLEEVLKMDGPLLRIAKRSNLIDADILEQAERVWADEISASVGKDN